MTIKSTKAKLLEIKNLNKFTLNKNEEEFLFHTLSHYVYIILDKILFYKISEKSAKQWNLDTGFIYRRINLLDRISYLKRYVVVIKSVIDLLIEKNLRLAYSISKKYSVLSRGQNFIQEGSQAIIKSITKFDITKGYKFSTFATMAIRQAIVKSINDNHRLIRVPTHKVQEMWKKGSDVPYTKQISTESVTGTGRQKVVDSIIGNNSRIEFKKLGIMNKIDELGHHLTPTQEFHFRVSIYLSGNIKELNKYLKRNNISKQAFQNTIDESLSILKQFV